MMSTPTPNPLAAAQDPRIDVLFGLASSSLEAFAKLTALNLDVLRFGLAENQELLNKALAANNVQELLALPTLIAPAMAGRMLSYSHQLSDIAAAVQQQFPTSAQIQRRKAQSETQRSSETPAKPSATPADTGSAASASATTPGSAPAPAARKSTKRAIPVATTGE
jgi:phasin family protein